MIVVKLELWPGGHEARAREIGRMYVANDANKSVCTNGTRGDYNAVVARRGQHDVRAAMANPTRRGSVKDYPRLSYNVWRLIIRCLLSAFPEESK